jgi:hypothetical protein
MGLHRIARSVALLLPIAEVKSRSDGWRRELSYFVVPEKEHGSWSEIPPNRTS